MTIQISSVLGFLVLLAVTQAADQTCEDLTKPLVLEDDYSSIMGKWVFSEGVANHPLFTHILLTLNSSLIEFSPSSSQHTVVLSQSNMLNGICEFSTTNGTIKHSKSSFTNEEKGVVSEGDFLPTCSDCVLLHFTSHFQNKTINSLYLFTKAHGASKSDMEQYWKQAECLGFKKEPQFSYDGVTEFCQVDKNSPPTEHAKPEEKKEE